MIKYTYYTWDDFLKKELHYWKVVFIDRISLIKDVEIVYKGWEDVKPTLRASIENASVREPLNDMEEMVRRLEDEVRPIFVEWLNDLSKSEKRDYTEYIQNFFREREGNK